MNEKSDIWEVTRSDVLIIGGGFGGLWAALRAAEGGSSVILVDKSFAGKSGHSFFAGGAFLALCDLVARTIVSPTEMPVGIITAMVGGPLFLRILLRDRGPGSSI